MTDEGFPDMVEDIADEGFSGMVEDMTDEGFPGRLYFNMYGNRNVIRIQGTEHL